MHFRYQKPACRDLTNHSFIFLAPPPFLRYAGIADKKDTFLLDINGRPRKSPREHASTLAILSCLVQQRRQHEKAINGGISPEKRTPAAADSDKDNENEDCPSEPDDAHTTDQERRPAPTAETTEDDENSNNHPDLHKPDAANSELAVEDPPTPEPIVKRPKNEFPRMPISDYVNPHAVCRQIDELLTFDDEAYDRDDEDLQSLSTTDLDPDDLVLISTPKDFLEIVTSVEEGPLRYRGVNLRLPTGLSSFSRRKRKNNRTGWPSVPRRRRTSNANVRGPEEDEDEEDTTTCSVSNATEEADAEEEECDEEDSRCQLPMDITQRLETEECCVLASSAMSDAPFRGKFSEFTSVEGRNSVVFTSSSDKAENSDIFTVSSDSLDTADLTTAVATVATSGIASASQSSSQPLTVEDDESSSVDVTLAELLQTTQLETHRKPAAVGHFNCKPPNRRRTSSTAKKSSFSPPSRRLQVMQPVIRVKKISPKTLLAAAVQRQRNRMMDGATDSLPGHKTPPPQLASTSTADQQQQRVVTITGSGRKSIGRQSCSPKAKFSPPKLRKPRGRWYRER